MSSKKRLVSGIQPTGKMHLGNYLGAISNWTQLQHQFDAYFMIADLHSLTTVYESPQQLREDKLNLAIDLLACGIDPEKACLFYQSEVPEHAELHLILSMITPLPWLERVPTYKSKMEEIQSKDLHTYGFLGYPVLQTADILLYKAQAVPVGRDQLPHLELAREITRRFNHLYTPIFPEPEDLLTPNAVLPGTDGRKMSKSYGNTIAISDDPDTIRKKTMSMLTDPNRKRRHDPGNPDICPVFAFHNILTPIQRQKEIDALCRSAEIGCVDCKKEMADALIHFLKEIHNKRKELENNKNDIQAILKKGAEKARQRATETITEVKKAIGL